MGSPLQISPAVLPKSALPGFARFVAQLARLALQTAALSLPKPPAPAPARRTRASTPPSDIAPAFPLCSLSTFRFPAPIAYNVARKTAYNAAHKLTRTAYKSSIMPASRLQQSPASPRKSRGAPAASAYTSHPDTSAEELSRSSHRT